MTASPPSLTDLGAAIKARRYELGLTQEYMALRSGLHQRWISNVETGKRNLSYRSLCRLLSALDLSLSELVARAEATAAAESAGSDLRSQP
jgi:transcriptional regulator with XRE-family HTH domain